LPAQNSIEIKIGAAFEGFEKVKEVFNNLKSTIEDTFKSITATKVDDNFATLRARAIELKSQIKGLREELGKFDKIDKFSFNIKEGNFKETYKQVVTLEEELRRLDKTLKSIGNSSNYAGIKNNIERELSSIGQTINKEITATGAIPFKTDTGSFKKVSLGGMNQSNRESFKEFYSTLEKQTKEFYDNLAALDIQGAQERAKNIGITGQNSSVRNSFAEYYSQLNKDIASFQKELTTQQQQANIEFTKLGGFESSVKEMGTKSRSAFREYYSQLNKDIASFQKE
jgi:vacuolar-type H+-ATPase subunit I/STV1